MTTREANYAGAFDGRLKPGARPALLIIDMVMAYLEPSSPLYFPHAQQVVDAVNRLAAATRAAGAPVIFTQVVYKPGGGDGGLFYRKVPALSVFDEGSPLGVFPPDMQPAAGDVIVTKQYASSFFGTSLVGTLNANRIDTVLLTGFSTSGCVRATGLDTLQHGFVPLVVREGCGDRHPDPHESNLFDLQAKYAEVIGEAEAITYLQGLARAG